MPNHNSKIFCAHHLLTNSHRLALLARHIYLTMRNTVARKLSKACVPRRKLSPSVHHGGIFFRRSQYFFIFSVFLGQVSGCAETGKNGLLSGPSSGNQPTIYEPLGKNGMPDSKDLAEKKQQFIQATALQYGFAANDLESILDNAVFQPSIYNAMQQPAEKTKTWDAYRAQFITTKRIEAGQRFLEENSATLHQVESKTGVPAEIIAAIIGVETSYGANTGRYRVLDALYTLAFAYPMHIDPILRTKDQAREKYFSSELAQFIVLCRQEQLPITKITGSYAGAMGMGQFMPSSYLQYAVDGDNDGHRDMFSNSADVIASVGNYLKVKGKWMQGGLIAVPAILAPGYQALDFNPSGPQYTLAALKTKGYTPQSAINDSAMASPIHLTGDIGQKDWLVFQNFYAILRYNSSPLYAMAVFGLAQAIAGYPVTNL